MNPNELCWVLYTTMVFRYYINKYFLVSRALTTIYTLTTCTATHTHKWNDNSSVFSELKAYTFHEEAYVLRGMTGQTVNYDTKEINSLYRISLWNTCSWPLDRAVNILIIHNVSMQKICVGMNGVCFQPMKARIQDICKFVNRKILRWINHWGKILIGGIIFEYHQNLS